MKPKAEWHRRRAAVAHRGADLQGAGRQPHLHAKQELEGVGLQRLRRVPQLQCHAATIRQGLHLPGQLPREAVLGERERPLGQGQLVVRQPAGDREQHWETASHRLGGIEEALQIEVHHLHVAAAPAADQAAALGYHSQQITAGGIAQLPVGIGLVPLRQWHGRSG